MLSGGGPMNKENEFVQKAGKVYRKASQIIDISCKWVFRLRKVIMAAPVVYFALKLAGENADRLPKVVGLDLQATGEFAHTVSRTVAVQGPLLITAAALALMFISKKAVFPWIVSILTLLLPYLIYFTNLHLI